MITLKTNKIPGQVPRAVSKVAPWRLQWVYSDKKPKPMTSQKTNRVITAVIVFIISFQWQQLLLDIQLATCAVHVCLKVRHHNSFAR